MNTKQIITELMNTNELIQDDLLTYFDGLPADVQEHMCSLVVNRFNELYDKLGIRPIPLVIPKN